MLILRRLYSRRSNSARYVKPAKIDPGILRQRKIVTETQEDASNIDFEELESDFMSVDKSHREHIRQMEAWKEKEKYLIVKRKYFTEKLPNFLTWHDKEQIRYLHNSDPEEWSIENLSDAFPALPYVIEKIIKNKWTKKTPGKISAHDRSVMQHWADYKQGKLYSLPNELKEHLQKFSNRSLNLKPFEISNNKSKIVSKVTREGEFSEIITSYQRLQSQNVTNKIEDQKSEPKYLDGNNTYSSDTVSTIKHKTVTTDNTLLTFKELQKSVQKDLLKGKNVPETEKLILKETKLPSKEDLNTTIALKPEEISSILEHRHETNTGKVGFVKKTRDMSYLVYPDKIAIPKQHYKMGFTYKLNDCYYDSDGEFLYRVPGMS